MSPRTTNEDQAELARFQIMRFVFIAAFILAVPARVYADSDGYYCLGPGYVAVQFRSFHTPGLKGAHVVKIARFDEAKGPRWSSEIALEDFQPHTFVCGAKTILIEGAGDDRRLISYTIRVEADSLQIVSRTRQALYPIQDIPHEPQNLGSWAKPGMIVVSDFPGRPMIRIRITETIRKEPGALVHEKRSTLEEVSRAGVVTRNLLLAATTDREFAD